ncbi:MAG TPA: hypothetical protein VMR50_04510 [Myxococcota bacterium]|nr:hypothetical protein [Myxococcota bacterium]
MTTSNATLTVGEARARYFAEAGFPPDGGYAAKFVQLGKLGPVPFGFPNSNSRRKAVALHDLHHVLTGYKTDWTGEAEISAFEIASGCGRMWFAWYINLQGMLMGWLVDPGATWRAWVRGRYSRNLYLEGYSEALLREPVQALRQRLGLDRPAPAPSARDYASYAFWGGLALVDAAVTLSALALPIAGVLKLFLRG